MGAPAPDLPAKATDAIDTLARLFPRPTNAQALAALDGLSQAADADAGVRQGLTELVAESYLMTLGVLPRMRFLASGWTNPGDKLRLPTDAAWWSATYKFPLWDVLFTFADIQEKAGLSPSVAWQQPLSEGDQGELSQTLLAVASELATIVRLKQDTCTPYIIPTKRGVLPTPSFACLAKVKGKEAIDERKQRKDDATRASWVKAGLFFGAIYVIAFHFRHGRVPWR